MKNCDLDRASHRRYIIDNVCKCFIPCRCFHICNCSFDSLRSFRLLTVDFNYHIRIYPLQVDSIELGTDKGKVEGSWHELGRILGRLQRDKLDVK